MEIVALTELELERLETRFLVQLYRDGWTMEDEGEVILFYR